MKAIDPIFLQNIFFEKLLIQFDEILADRKGFEPSERGHRSLVFKTSALNRSATYPIPFYIFF